MVQQQNIYEMHLDYSDLYLIIHRDFVIVAKHCQVWKMYSFG